MTRFEAIVLAGGFGTRLRSVTGDLLPKPMVPVGGRPFLDHVLGALVAAGATRIVMATGHLGDVVEAHYGATFRGVPLVWSREEEPLGTGGALRHAFGAVDGDDAVAVNGDTYVALDLAALVARHRAEGATSGAGLLTMTAVAVPDVARFGALDVVDGRVVRLVEKGTVGPGLINAGVYALSRGLFDLVGGATRFSLEADLLAPFLGRLAPAVVVADWMIDIGVPDDHRRADLWFSGDRTGRP